MHEHDTGQRNDYDRLHNDWPGKVTIADQYEKHRPEFLKQLIPEQVR